MYNSNVITDYSGELMKLKQYDRVPYDEYGRG